MSAAPVLSDATLSRGGELLTPPASKKPVYAVLTIHRSSFKKPAAPVRQPKHLRFGAVGHPKLRVLKPIPVEISNKRGMYIATFKQVSEFGCGKSLSSALDDLGKTLAELYLGLTEQYESLGSDLQNLHTMLSRYLAVRQR